MSKSDLRIKVMSGISATCNGRPVPIGGDKARRRLLAVLAHDANREITAARLVEWVWGEDNKDTRGCLYTEISRLNKVFGSVGAGRRIVNNRATNSYRLELADGELDLLEAAEWARRAIDALDAGRHQRAAELARKALALSDGEPFGDLGTTWPFETIVPGMEARRRLVLRVLVEAELATGHAEQAVLGAQDLVQHDRGNQRFAGLLARALYASGRAPEALEAIQACRRCLREVGLVLDKELTDLEAAVLANDPAPERLLPSRRGSSSDADAPAGLRTLFAGSIAGRTGDAISQGLFETELVLAVRDHHGDVIEAGDDHLVAAFDHPLDGVLAALAAARACAGPDADPERPVRPAMAVHTVIPGPDEPGDAGPDLRHVQALCDAAHPGQILVSEATRGLVVDRIPLGTRLRLVAVLPVAAAERFEEVHQLSAEDLPSDFPHIAAPAEEVGQPTRYTTSFLGRGREIVEVADRIRPGAVVTIVGSGGIGKTRLAAEVIARPLHDPVEVRFCNVSLCDTASEVHERLARCLGLDVGGRGPGPPVRDLVVDALVGFPVLLVLDGCERQRTDVADLLGAVRARPAAACVLVTSRIPLDIDGEDLVQLGPLATDADEPGALPHALELLLARIDPATRPVRADGPDLAKLVRCLDGVPLAIELVARQLGTTSARTLVEHIEESIGHAVGPAWLPEHQRSLVANYRWTIELANPAERRLAAALSVLDGAWTDDAARALAPAVDVDPAEVRRILGHLVGFSIVRMQATPGRPASYRMPDTIRACAAVELRDMDRMTAVAGLHAEHFLGIVEAALPHRRGPDEAAWVAGVFAELDNIRAAHRHLMAAGRYDDDARLVLALADDLLTRELVEVGRWAVELGRTPGARGCSRRAEVLGLAANALMDQGHLAEALALATEAVGIEATSGTPGRAWAAHNVLAMAGLAYHGAGDENVEFGVHIHRMEDISSDLGDPFPRALALWDRVVLAELSGQVDRAAQPADSLAALAVQHDNASLRAMALIAQGRVRTWERDHDEARRLLHEALGAAKAAANTYLANCVRHDLAALAEASDPRIAIHALLPVARALLGTCNVTQQFRIAVLLADRLAHAGRPAPAARALIRLSRTPLVRTDRFDEQVDTVLAMLSPSEQERAHEEAGALVLPDLLAGLIASAERLQEEDDDDDGSEP